jgi:Zn-finger nucleic acid-binding protein
MNVPAGSLACPSCGAPAAPEALRCDHCATPLALVACPGCLGRIFRGARFCSHCGGSAARATPADARPVRACPRCRQPLAAAAIGTATLDECTRCGGVWAERPDLERILAASESQSKAETLGAPTKVPAGGASAVSVSYVPCPTCTRLMNRFNFARCSGVIVDVCKPHGTWFDRDELQRLVAFVHQGGLARARQHEREDLEQERGRLRLQQQLLAARERASGVGGSLSPGWSRDARATFHVADAVAIVGAALFELFGD